MSSETYENRPKRVFLFATCLVDQFFPEVGEATVHLIESADIDVIYPEGLTCCGLPHFNNGFRAEARKILETQLHLLEGDIPIIVPSGSCGWMLKCVLPTLFPDDPWEREKAAQIAGRVIEVVPIPLQDKSGRFRRNASRENRLSRFLPSSTRHGRKPNAPPVPRHGSREPGGIARLRPLLRVRRIVRS